MKTTLSKEMQIKVLENAIYQMGTLRVKYGLCILLSHIIHCGIGNYLPKEIEGFNITNARKLSKKYKFITPNGVGTSFWWRKEVCSSVTEWYKPRIAFIEALITELKNN